MPQSASRQKELYHRKRLRRLCVEGGCWKRAELGRCRCKRHQELKAHTSKSRWQSGKTKRPTREERKAYWTSVRKQVLDAYGAKCSCCGESGFPFLTMDHINGGGNAFRKRQGTSHSFYLWLRRNGYPSGYQVLCWNCNLAKQMFGRNANCPHKMGCAIEYARG